MWWSYDTYTEIELHWSLCTCVDRYIPQSHNNGPLVCDDTVCLMKRALRNNFHKGQWLT